MARPLPRPERTRRRRAGRAARMGRRTADRRWETGGVPGSRRLPVSTAHRRPVACRGTERRCRAAEFVVKREYYRQLLQALCVPLVLRINVNSNYIYYSFYTTYWQPKLSGENVCIL